MTEPKAPHLILIESPDAHRFPDIDIQTMIHVGGPVLGGGSAPPAKPRHPILKDEVIIGRSSGCDIVLNHITVSRRHFAIRKGDGLCTIKDLGGASGTQLNGQELADEAPLQHGDQVKAGRYLFLFSWE